MNDRKLATEIIDESPIDANIPNMSRNLEGDGERREVRSVQHLSELLAVDWPAIRSAEGKASDRKAELHALVEPYVTSDASFVVFGSVARMEVTSQSDLDWILLVDGQADPAHTEMAQELAEVIAQAGFKEPGKEATFGAVVPSHDLIQNIGGEEDSSVNTTRRLLLLLESTPIGRPDAHQRTVNNVLNRYVREDYGLVHGTVGPKIPRFLQNDVVRYWRTLCVDFAYKRRARGDQGWALRTAKLRMSRKLIYVAGLLMCYACALDPEIATLDSATGHDAAPDIVEFFLKMVGQTPLERVACILGASPAHDNALRDIFCAYDEFLSMLDNNDTRAQLESLTRTTVSTDATYHAVRTLSDRFEEALLRILVDDPSSEFFKLTRKLAVF